MVYRNTVKSLHNISTRAWMIWFLAALFYGYEFLIRVSPNVMASQIMADYGVKATALGVMASAFYWAYALWQLPAGVMVDRFGAKKLLFSGALLVALGNLIFSMSHVVFVGCIARAIIGLGASFAFLCTLKLITEWFPIYRFAFLTGMTNLIGYIGATLGGAPLAAVLAHISWRHVLFIAAIVGLIIAALCLLIVRDRPDRSKVKSLSPHATVASVIIGLRSVLSKTQSWYNAIFTGLMVAPTSTFAALWGVTYLVQVDHLSIQTAAIANSLIFIGVVSGSPIFGIFSDYIRRRKPPLIIATAGVLIVTLLILYAGAMPIFILYTLCFLFGFFQSAHVLNFAIANEINRPAATGSAIGFTNMALVLGGAISQPIVGSLLTYGWDGTYAKGVPVYSTADFHHALFILPLAQATALFIAIFLIKDTYCNSVYRRKQSPIIY